MQCFLLITDLAMRDSAVVGRISTIRQEELSAKYDERS